MRGPGFDITGTETSAEFAVRYALSRVITDPDFRWHMLGTETLRLMIRAEAERRGIAEEEFESEFLAAVERHAPEQSKPQIIAAREEADRLRGIAFALSELEPEPEPDDPKWSIAFETPLEYLERTS